MKTFTFLKNKQGTVTVESLLTVPLFLLVIFLLIGMLELGEVLLILDQSLTKVTEEIYSKAYLYQELQGLIEGKEEELLVNITQDLLADTLLGQELSLYTPMVPISNLSDIMQVETDLDFKNDRLTITLYLKGKELSDIQKLIPGNLDFTLKRSVKLMLTGENIYPGMGEESYLGNKLGSVVYITKWGECYHQENCIYLEKSKIPIKLTEAKESYRACSKCF